MITLVVNPGSFWLTAAKLGRAKRRFKFVENWKKGFGNGNLDGTQMTQISQDDHRFLLSC